jgi:hypothetical protein
MHCESNCESKPHPPQNGPAGFKVRIGRSRQVNSVLKMRYFAEMRG